MSILVVILVVLIVAGLLNYGVDLVPQLAPMNSLIKLFIIFGAVLFILTRTGMI